MPIEMNLRKKLTRAYVCGIPEYAMFDYHGSDFKDRPIGRRNKKGWPFVTNPFCLFSSLKTYIYLAGG